MKRAHDSSEPSSPNSKHVKFSHNDNSASSSSSPSKHTLESIREAKSLRKIKQQKGFENTMSILGQTTERHDGLEGEEGNFNEERFVDEQIIMEPFHLQREREEGLFRDENDHRSEHERKKKKKEHAILRKAVNQDSDDEDGSSDEERDEWANDLEEMKPLSIVNTKSTATATTEKTVPTLEQCNECIVRILNDRKESVSTALKRLKDEEKNELIRHVNTLISNYGQYDAYDRKRESFQKKVQWEYQVNDTMEVHGPFSTREIQSWIDMGCLISDNITIRIFSLQCDQPFQNLNEFDFTRYN